MCKIPFRSLIYSISPTPPLQSYKFTSHFLTSFHTDQLIDFPFAHIQTYMMDMLLVHIHTHTLSYIRSDIRTAFNQKNKRRMWEEMRLKWKGKQVLARRNSWCDGIRKKRGKTEEIRGWKTACRCNEVRNKFQVLKRDTSR